LIIEIYWALVKRTRRTDARNRAAANMSSAYALLMDEEERRQYDCDRQLDCAAPDSSHYATLRIDACADTGIIDTAYSFMRQHGRQLKRAERQAIEVAYRILANHNLRAQYDVSRRTINVAPAEGCRASATVFGGRSDASAKIAHRKRRAIFMRRRRDAPDAQDARLLDLRSIAIASMPELPSGREDELASGVDTAGEIVFIEGSQAGLRISIGDVPISIGSATCRRVRQCEISPAGHLTVWQRGDRFMLSDACNVSQVGGGHRFMVLDDGDEIVLGSQRMRFRHIPGN
jgi:curved DNA-binding protein CbpA